jgi:hypothetical protein
MVCFTNRRVAQAKAKPPAGDLFGGVSNPVVSESGYAAARKAAPGYDIHGLYHEWVSWWRDSGCPELTNSDKAFIGFCRTRHERAPLR